MEYGYDRVNGGLDKIIDNYNPNNHQKYVNDWRNYVENNLKKWNEKSAKDAFELWTSYFIPLINAVKGYNEYKPNMDPNESASLSMTIKVNGKEVRINNLFDKKLIDNGVYKTVSSTRLTALSAKNFTNPVNYIKSNKENPYKVKLVPKFAYITKYLGKIAENENEKKESISGGNKVYIDYDVDVDSKGTTYPMEIKVDGLLSNDSNIINDKCNITLKKLDILYRPIDVKNPFINDKWNKGENWVNSKFDFTQTINPNTWNVKSLKNVEISGSQIAKIKKSNSDYTKSGDSPYLGICDRNGFGKKDEITEEICEVIKGLK